MSALQPGCRKEHSARISEDSAINTYINRIAQNIAKNFVAIKSRVESLKRLESAAPSPKEK